jgi:hypothetical protein
LYNKSTDVFSTPFEVYAYANVNPSTDGAGRTLTTPSHVAVTSLRSDDVLYRGYQQYFDRGGYVSAGSYFYLSAIGAWQTESLQAKLSDMSWAYFSQVKNNLASSADTTDLNNAWFNAGVFSRAQYQTLFKYGYADPALVRRQAVAQSRGQTVSLGALESEEQANALDPGTVSALGYLAVDYLATNYGEQAVYKSFWENYPISPGLRADFKSTFGMTTAEFYAKFADYLRTQ